MKDIELIINRWYKQWLLTNDPYEDSFEDELDNLLPHIKFSMNLMTNEWLIINS